MNWPAKKNVSMEFQKLIKNHFESTVEVIKNVRKAIKTGMSIFQVDLNEAIAQTQLIQFIN